MADDTSKTGYKGPSVPHRTSRSIAIEKGTDPAGFKEDVPYDVAKGHPVAKQYPQGEYKAAKIDGATPPSGKPMDIPAPFSLGSK